MQRRFPFEGAQEFWRTAWSCGWPSARRHAESIASALRCSLLNNSRYRYNARSASSPHVLRYVTDRARFERDASRGEEGRQTDLTASRRRLMCDFHRPAWSAPASLAADAPPGAGPHRRERMGDGNGRARGERGLRTREVAGGDGSAGTRDWLSGTRGIPLQESNRRIGDCCLCRVLSNAVSDWITKDGLAEETRQREAALLVKAFEHNDPNVVMAKLNLLNLTGMISDATSGEEARRAGVHGDREQDQKPAIGVASTVSGGADPKAIENDDLDKVLRKLKLLDEANLIPDYDRFAGLRDAQHDGRASCDAADVEVVSASTRHRPRRRLLRRRLRRLRRRQRRRQGRARKRICATAAKSAEGGSSWAASTEASGNGGVRQRHRSIEFESSELNAGPASRSRSR